MTTIEKIQYKAIDIEDEPSTTIIKKCKYDKRIICTVIERSISCPEANCFNYIQFKEVIGTL